MKKKKRNFEKVFSFDKNLKNKKNIKQNITFIKTKTIKKQIIYL